MEIIGIGTDIISNKRKIQAKIGMRFLSKEEKIAFESLFETQKDEFLFGRWAAKESIIKALNKKIALNNISIINNENGKPIVYIFKILRDDIYLSISHEKNYTIAFSIIVRV